MVASFVTHFFGGLVLFPAFCFVALVITGAAGQASFILVQVEMTIVEWKIKREGVGESVG